MGKFDGYLLMSDFDGTLAYGGTISRENCEAIGYFQSEGGLFSLASGRAPSWIGQWKDFVVPNTWSAMLNGAILCDSTGEDSIFDAPLHENWRDVARMVLAACPKIDWVRVHNRNEFITLSANESIDTGELSLPIYKMVFRTSAEFSDAYAARIKELVAPHYQTARSWINGIEVQNNGTGKGDAVRRMKTLLGERVRLVIAVGDFENDIDMIKAADIGYAVGSAHPSVKAVADRVTVPAEEHAIAQIIAELEPELR